MSRLVTRAMSLITVVSLVSVLTACKSRDAINFEANAKAEITDFIDGKPGQVVSLSVVDGEKVYQYHFGKLPNGDAPTEQTIYEIGSITKTYTGLLVAQAILDGKVELDKDIRHYLTDNEYKNLELANQYITLRHLMTHTSGLPGNFSYTSEDKEKGVAFEKMSQYTRDDYFNDLKSVKLNSKPGDDYVYSSVGTNLAGYVLESVYQKPFAELIADVITAKSGEMQTKFRRSDLELAKVTVGTDRDGNQMPLASAYWLAGGGLTSNIESLTRYMQHQLSTAPEVAMSHQVLQESWTGNGQAFYWHTANYDSSEQMLYQSGGSMGSSSWLVIYPKKNIGIFIVTNMAGGSTQPELEAITDKVYDYLMAYHKALASEL